MRKACKADVETLCNDARKAAAADGEAKGKGGRGRGIMQCLRANMDKLTPECSTAVEARGKERGKGRG
jgi:hypothetical protein